MENQITKSNNNLANGINEKNITDKVLNQVTALTKNNSLTLPKNYNVGNALKFAYLDLQGQGLLNTDQAALATALLNMCVQGLSPQKKQCYFINYGGKVGMMRSYHGDRAVAILAGIAKDIQAYVIYQGDEVNTTYDPETNYLVVEHKTKFENWDKPVIGAYAVAILPDGTKRYDLMTIERIKASWEMSSNKNNNKLQTKFSTDACQRTVTRHLVKNLFNQTNDESLLIDNVFENEQAIADLSGEEKEDAADFVLDASGVVKAQAEETGTVEVKIEDKPKPQAQASQPQKSQEEKQDAIFSKHLGLFPEEEVNF